MFLCVKEVSEAVNAALSKGMVKWGRATIGMIGPGRAGKTATARSLVGKPFQMTESTVGIDQFDCTVNHAMMTKDSQWTEFSKTDDELFNAVVKLMNESTSESEAQIVNNGNGR
jgi:GTPase SAR1 family protein